MVNEKNLFEIGKLLKPNGIDGEITLLFNKPEFAELVTAYYFFALDGMYIPFFVEEFTYITDVTARIKLKGVDSIEEVSSYSQAKVLLPDKLLKNSFEKDRLYETKWHKFIGYTVRDESSSPIGVIENVDSSTLNILFNVMSGDDEVLIPATEDFIIKIDPEQKQLHLKLPDGLLEETEE